MLCQEQRCSIGNISGLQASWHACPLASSFSPARLYSGVMVQCRTWWLHECPSIACKPACTHLLVSGPQACSRPQTCHETCQAGSRQAAGHCPHHCLLLGAAPALPASHHCWLRQRRPSSCCSCSPSEQHRLQQGSSQMHARQHSGTQSCGLYNVLMQLQQHHAVCDTLNPHTHTHSHSLSHTHLQPFADSPRVWSSMSG